MVGRRRTDTATLAAALPLIEAERMGATTLLHNRESGAIVVADAFGALLFDALRATPDLRRAEATLAAALGQTAAALRPAIERLVAGWAADGVLLTGLRPYPDALPWRPPLSAPRHFATAAGSVALRCEDPDLAADLARALAPLALDEAANAGAVQLDALIAEPGYGVFRDRRAIWGRAPYELTRFHLLREIMDVLCGSDRVAAHLHASAVARDGAALVFAGASGSGKSTLATLMLGTGCALAADDHVALDTSGHGLFAFATRPNLKPGTAELPAVQAIVAQQDMRGGAGGGDFVPRARLPVAARLSLAGVVFPQYDPTGANALDPVEPEDALRALIGTGSRVSRQTRSLAPLAQALRRGPLRRLRYRDDRFATDTCLALLAG